MAESEQDIFDVMADTGDDSATFDTGPGDLTYDENAINLLTEFADHPDGDEAIEDVRSRVRKDFDCDWESGEEYRERRADDWKLFSGELTPKDFPFENCANGNVPITLENISRLQSRVYAEIVGNGRNVFGVMPVGPDDEEAAQLLSHHGNWQLREKIPDFYNQQHRGVLAFFLNGDVTSHSTWDDARRQNRHEMLNCDEFVVPYQYTSTMPDWSDCPHYSRVHYMHKHEIEAMKGVWVNVDKTLDRTPSFTDEPDAPLAVSVAEADDMDIPEISSAAPHKIIEYEGWLTLPNQTRERFCRVMYDYTGDHLLLLEIRESITWADKLEYDTKMSELNEYRDALEAYREGKELADAGMESLEADQSLLPEQKIATQAQLNAAMPEPEPPLPPRWMTNPDDPDEDIPEPRKTPIHMFAHGVCIDNLAGCLGLGLGRIEADLNIAANTMLNQYIDAASLSNSGVYLAHSDVEFDSPFEMQPGKMFRVDGIDPGELGNAIMPLKTNPGNSQLMDGVERFYNWGQSAIQAPSVLSGEPGKSGETARGLTSRIEQAVKQTSVSAGRYADFLTQQLKNNARLNSIFMPEQEFFMVNNHMGQNVQLMAGRAMYQRNYSVEIMSNLKFTPESQKQANAEATLQAILQIPQLASNQAIVYDAIVAWMKANENEAMIPKLGQAPMPPPQFPPVPPMPPEGAPQGPPPEGM